MFFHRLINSAFLFKNSLIRLSEPIFSLFKVQLKELSGRKKYPQIIYSELPLCPSQISMSTKITFLHVPLFYHWINGNKISELQHLHLVILFFKFDSFLLPTFPFINTTHPLSILPHNLLGIPHLYKNSSKANQQMGVPPTPAMTILSWLCY